MGATQKITCLSAIISPLARYCQFLSLAFACAASTYFRYTTKVGKGVPKKGKTTVRSGFLPFLWNLSHLSTVRGSPPSLKRRGLIDTIPQRGPRDLEIKRQRRGNCLFALVNVRHRTLAVRRRSAICGRGEGFQRERRNRLNGFLLSLWHAFPPFVV